MKKGIGDIMARCPYLDWESSGVFSNYKDDYKCKVSNRNLDRNEVKYKCYPGFGDSYGEEYKNCDAYKDA